MGFAAIAAAAVLGSAGLAVTSHASSSHGGSASSRSTGGDGGRASSNGGDGGDSTGGNGLLCGIGSGDASNDLNNLLGGQLQLLDGLNLLNDLFVPVLSPGAGADQNSHAGGSSISHSIGAQDDGDTGNTDCGSAGDAGDGGDGGIAKGGSGGDGGHASSHGGSSHSSKKVTIHKHG